MSVVSTMTKTMKYSFISLQSAMVSDLCQLDDFKRCNCSVFAGDTASSEVKDFIWLDFDGLEYLQADYLQHVDLGFDRPEDAFVFYLPLRGGMEIDQKYGRVVAGTGPTAVTAQDCRRIRFTPLRRHIRISIARKKLMAHLKLKGGGAIHTPLAFEQSPTVNHLSHVLGSMVFASFAAVSGNNGAFEERLSALGGMIEAAVLYLWPHNYAELVKSQNHTILPMSVKLAMDIIAADPFRPLAILDLARECGVSIRTLQYGFKAFASCTPREFVLQRRMQQLKQCASDQDDLAKLKTRVGLDRLRYLNQRYENMNGRPLVEWSCLTVGNVE
ncbi:AraC family transcriptional regulator [uncultured Agrobacterium sp.]|uniref:helix-turn-helix domain-containing protein n=1 Tax=uncultured Agrobacterium sp. TaxID=157277 RepID=UPI0025ED3D31|nr:AraC family transcriptional regulator [uncultured Agrobacterium sp.]